MDGPLLPGSTIGMLGSGQLGRMFTLAARRMGYRVHVLSSEADSPAGRIAHREVVAAYDDVEAVRRFAQDVDVVTLEFENLSSAAVEAAASKAPVRPGARALSVCQHRAREKRFLAEIGVPHAAFEEVPKGADVASAVRRLGGACLVKTAGFGYDGKGQVRVASTDDVAALAQARALGREQTLVVERFVDLTLEISVVLARTQGGATVTYAPIHNRHRDQILDLSSTPAPIDHALTAEAAAMARKVVEGLELVGLACVEFFLTAGGELLVNEIAPRPHNSGHLTLEAAETSQFEQQLRAVAGLPLGSTALQRPAAMANLMGELWQAGEPDWAAALSVPGVTLHLYGKREARAGRKMGHLTATAFDRATAETRVLDARARLVP